MSEAQGSEDAVSISPVLHLLTSVWGLILPASPRRLHLLEEMAEAALAEGLQATTCQEMRF